MLYQISTYYISYCNTLLTQVGEQCDCRLRKRCHIPPAEHDQLGGDETFVRAIQLTADDETAERDATRNDRYCDRFEMALRGARFDLDDQHMRDIALQVLALIDGPVLYYRSASLDDEMLARARRLARKRSSMSRDRSLSLATAFHNQLTEPDEACGSKTVCHPG